MNNNAEEQKQQSRRPPNRPSIGVRYGDMRGQLREAALLRAQRKGQDAPDEVQTVSPQTTDRVQSLPSIAPSVTQSTDIQSETNQSYQLDSDRAPPAADLEAQAAPSFEDLFDSHLAMRQAREASENDHNEQWNTFLDTPATMWQQRKCNIIMHTIAAVICIFSETPKCGIPLSFWLAVQFMFMTLESASMELKERMQQSLYWSATSNRRCRKWITGVCGATKELSEIAWQVYGAKLYFSDESDGCSEENQGFMFVLVMFLCIAALKVILISCFLCIVVVAFGARKLKRRNERSASRDILRSLGRIKYSTLSIGQSEPDEECSICFSEYGEDDVVTKLSCNEKHIFHEQCITYWIQQGKNSCPICRAPINSEIEL